MSETVKTIYVGNKPLPSYLQACYIAQEEGVEEIRFIARGHSILTAVNIASILQRNGGIINSIIIGSQKKPNFLGYVSTIQIDVRTHLE